MLRKATARFLLPRGWSWDDPQPPGGLDEAHPCSRMCRWRGRRARPRLNAMPSHDPTTVVLAHFDDLFARGLRELIESDPSLSIVAADIEHDRIPVVLRAHRPDVAILDVGALAKLAEVRELSEQQPATRLVLLANSPSMEECAQLLAFGASACLGRDTQSRDVLSAIHLASRGLQMTPRGTSDPGGGSSAGGRLLTRREAEVLPLLQQRRSNAQIAARPAGGRRDGSHPRAQHLPQARRLLSSRARRAARPDAPQKRALAEHAPRRIAPSGPARARRGHGLRRT